MVGNAISGTYSMPLEDGLKLIFVGLGPVSRSFRVPEVQNRGGMPATLDPDPCMHESDNQVRILGSPAGISLIEPVDPQQIIPPDSHAEGSE